MNRARRAASALDRLAKAAAGAAPHRIARVAADLEIEAEAAITDAAAYATTGDKPGAHAALTVASAITEIRQLLIKAEGGGA